VAVGFDAATEFPTTQSAGASNTLTLSWNHIPVTSTPKGVGLFVTYAPSSLTYVTTVKYGGVALSKVASARDTATEPGVMEFWYLGAGVPTGTNAFNVVRLANTAGMWGAGFTVSASTDTVVSQFLTVEENTSLVERTLSTVGIGTRFAGAYYGGAAPPGQGANSTTVFDIDYGAYGARVVRETVAGSGNRVVGFAAGTADDIAAIYVAIEESIAKTTISAIGVASGLAFGTAALTNRFNLLASSKASDAAFGQVSLTFNRVLLPPSKAADTAFGTLTVLQDIEYSVSASVPPGYKYTVLNNPELSANWSIGSSYGSTLSTSDIVIFKEFAFRDGSTATYSVTISTNGRVFVNSGADSSSYTVEYFLWDEETSLYGTTRTFAIIQSLVTALTVSAVGKASDLAFGTLVLQARNTVTPSGKATDEAFGTASLIARTTVFPNGLASGEAYGTPQVLSRYTVLVNGLVSDLAFGTTTVSAGDVTLSVAGKASDLAFGTFSVTGGGESTASFSVSATVPPGYKFTILSSPEISNTYNIGYSLSPTLVTGDIVIFSEWATQNGTTTSYSVTITTAGYPIVDAMSTSGSLSFQYFIWDDSAQSYGSTGTYSMLEFAASQTVYTTGLGSGAAFGIPSLIKDQILSYQNGIYTYTTNLPLITLTRADFYDETQEIRQGDVINVQFGNTHELSTWVQTQIINTIGIDSITYIGPLGPPGPQGPQGPEGPRGPRGPSGGGGGGDSIFGRIASGIANGIANALVNRLTDTALGGLALAVSVASLGVSAGALSNSLNKPRGAQYTSGVPTVDLVANLNLHNSRIENIAQSPGGDFDAVSARWVWDLLNDNVEIKWEK